MVHIKDYGERSSVGRAPDCDSGCRGFESHRSPQLDLFGKISFSIATAMQKGALCARVAELVDALDLGSSGVTRESSSLSFRTSFLK